MFMRIAPLVLLLGGAAAIRQELADRGTISLDEPIFGRFDFHQEWDEMALHSLG